MDPGTSSHHGLSTLRDFIPRVANIRLQSPISLWGFGGQGGAAGDRTIDGPTDKPLSRTECGPGPNQRLCSQSSFNSPQPAGCCTGRPVTLHWMASLPWTSSAAHNCMELGAVHHDIKYMGSVEVIQSMRTLDFDTRIQVTREAISRLCEKTSDKTKVKTKRSVCKGRSAILGQINLRFSGSRIVLSVSTDSLTLITASSLQKIAHHPMQAISFASRGDPDMADYIAYVAKDLTNHRACHILECPQGRACEVISSIGQAFETSFHQLLSHWPSLLSSNPRSAVRICPNWRQQETITEQNAKQEAENSAHCNYYNVIPGKTPPPGGTEDLRITRETKLDAHTQDPWSRPVSLFKNCSITEETPAPPADSGGSEVSPEQCTPLSESPDRDLIQEEGWFHGRKKASRVTSHLQWRFSGQREQLCLRSVCTQWYGGRQRAASTSGRSPRTGTDPGSGVCEHWPPGAFPHGEPDTDHFWKQ
ncbi:SHC-transforming protein 1-like isoform X2 [Echeneis naucrates]|uniref:SHC-transforming protein 1-like isoform X2 n=1 Tax=Echeneis naucrates TaxID=173247 RepID=UPI001113407E|nr:SHC-transforming protein 4 isoform X2 [Echeneis naucrates]